MRTINTLISACTIIACVSSCASLGKYQHVDTVSDTLYGNVAGANESTGIANFSWQEIFTDPAMQSLIGEALAANLDLKIAEEHIAQAKAQLTGAKLAYIPTLGISAAADGSLSGSGLKDKNSGYGLAANASWQLNIFRLINNQKAAQATVEQMRDYQQAVQAGIVSSVADTYYSLLMLDAQLLTAKDMQTTWKESVSTVVALKEAGLADQVAVSQYEANLSNINLTVSTLEGQILTAENAMNLLLAKEPGNKIVRGTLASQNVPDRISAGVPAQMLTLRPDVKAAELELELAHYAKRGAILDYFPNLTLSGSVDPLSPLMGIAASLTAPILAAGQHRANLEAAASRQNEAKLSFTKTLLEAGKEVNDAFNDFNIAGKMADDHYARVLSLDQARKDTEYLMRNSLDKTYLDVLYANTNYLEAKLNAIANQTKRLQAVVNIYTALGGGYIENDLR